MNPISYSPGDVIYKPKNDIHIMDTFTEHTFKQKIFEMAQSGIWDDIQTITLIVSFKTHNAVTEYCSYLNSRDAIMMIGRTFKIKSKSYVKDNEIIYQPEEIKF